MAVAAAPVMTPVALDPDGVLRVGESRVTLDTVVEVFESGAAPEEIVSRYPGLQLADVYAAIALYLQHRPEVDVYLARRKAKAEAVELAIRSQPGMQNLRSELLARRRE